MRLLPSNKKYMESWSDSFLELIYDWSQIVGVFTLLVTFLAGLALYSSQKEMARRAGDREQTTRKATNDAHSLATEAVARVAALKHPRFSVRANAMSVFVGGSRVTVPALPNQVGILGFTEKGLGIAGRTFRLPVVTGYMKDRILCVNASIFAGEANPPVTLVDNEFSEIPAGWDFNSDDMAAEIIDDKGKPVFQLIYTSDSTATLNGVFVAEGKIVTADAFGIREGTGDPVDNRLWKFLTNPPPMPEVGMTPIFKYPSAQFEHVRLIH